jgi:hypothetical protein
MTYIIVATVALAVGIVLGALAAWILFTCLYFPVLEEGGR